MTGKPKPTPVTLVRRDGSTTQSHGAGNGNPKAEPFPVVYGHDSGAAIERQAEAVRTALLEICPHLDVPDFAPAVARFLRAEARSLLLHSAILKQAEERGGEDKVSSRLWEQATAADRLAAQLGNTLGLDPLGRAKLHQVATSAELNVRALDDLAADGRRALDARPPHAIDGTADEDES